MKKSLSQKFAKVAGAGLLGLAMLAGAGCSQAPQTPAQQQASAEKDRGIYADDCVIVDKTPGFPYQASYSANTYDFRNGVVHFNTTPGGYNLREATTAPISSLNETGKARTMDMYNKLPASAKCEAPKLGPK